MAVKKPERISLRVYPVGFGDCFLLGFHYGGKDDRYLLIDFGSTGLTSAQLKAGKSSNGFMKQIADDVAARCAAGKGGRLHAVVATHRHADHISGFTTKSKASGADESGDVIRSLKPKYVLQPWTEHPDLDKKALGPADEADVAGAHAFRAALSGMQACAEGIAREAARLDGGSDEDDEGDPDGPAPDDDGAEPADSEALIKKPRRLRSMGVIRFVGEDNIANKSAVTNLIEMGKKGKPLFLFSGQKPALGLPGVKTYVLGPPTLRQSESIRKQRSRDDVEFWMLLGATAAKFTATAGPPSPGLVRGSQVPDRVRWLRDRVREARVEVLLPIVRALDQQMNNTSLILVFEVGEARLLFPGDAQIENWQYALSKAEYRELLAKTTLYKVGHHGSRNATPKKGLWGIFDKKSAVGGDDRMWSIVSTMPGKHGTTAATKVPRQTLVDALKQNTNFRNTHDFKLKAPSVASDFEIDPTTGRVTEA